MGTGTRQIQCKVQNPAFHDKPFYSKPLCNSLRVLKINTHTHQILHRFDASHRTYKYFFLKRNLDLDQMRAAANRMLGVHDFRNFCKMDVVNVSNFERTILSVSIQVTGSVNIGDVREEICEVEIKGQAFLWHQARTVQILL
jgi:tRNA pseudouridine38/39 synthase